MSTTSYQSQDHQRRSNLIAIGVCLFVLQLYLGISSDTSLAVESASRTGFGLCIATLLIFYGNQTISKSIFSGVAVVAFTLFVAIAYLAPVAL